MSTNNDKMDDKEINKLQDGIKQITSELDRIKSFVEESANLTNKMEFNDLTDDIAQLKQGMVKPKEEDTMDTTPPPIDGETCMHGNSWHSNCSDCDDLDNIEVVLNEIANIIDNEPNDKELGKKIRDFYNKYQEFTEENSDNTNNIDI